MKQNTMIASALAIALAACSQPADEVALAPSLSTEQITAAVANDARPEQARALDANRKPAEVLAFFGLEEGDAAVDVVSGGGYWAEILANAVGENGSVTALEPEQFYDETAWSGLSERAPTIKVERYPFEAFSPGADRFDFAIMNLNYHDVYWESEQYQVPRSEPQEFLAQLYSAMKPGGIVGVIDHAGNEGDTRAIVEATHRIAKSVVVADFEAAGFELEAESDMLANPDDDYEMGVFNPEIRGKTDRFVLKFIKPA